MAIKPNFTREFALDPADKTASGKYRAVIAVNDDVGDGQPINLRGMSLDKYRSNPVILLNHDRWDRIPIARTTNIEWTDRGLEAEFEFLPKDNEAAKVRNAWDRGFLRAASISVRPTDHGQHEMIEWSIVTVPADADAVRAVQRSAINEILEHKKEEPEMTPEEIQSAIERALEAREGEKKPNAKEVTERLAEVVKEQVATALNERNEAIEAKTKAEADAKSAAERAEVDAEARADLLVMVRSLIPEGTETKGKTAKDLLVLAAGDEVENAVERSEDYLLAKVEEISKRRNEASRKLGNYFPPATAGMKSMSKPMNVIQMKDLRKKRA